MDNGIVTAHEAPGGEADGELPALTFPADFVWGAATAAPQVEGSNTNNDWWDWEHQPGSPCTEPSGDACGSYEHWSDDVGLVAGLGLTSYRFSLEWSRIEPADGEWSTASLEHYRRMCAALWERGVEPTVTFHHFTLPRWFARDGGWESPRAVDLFGRFCAKAGGYLGDLIGRACTINEPNVVSFVGYDVGAFPPGRRGDRTAMARVDATLAAAHRRAVETLRAGRGRYPVGLTYAFPVLECMEGGEPFLAEVRETTQMYLDAARADDFVGLQCYTRNRVGAEGLRPPPPGARITANGWEYYPQAVERALREVGSITAVPILVTENGIATDDDAERIDYMDAALRGLHRCVEDGVDVRGYFHWSLLDNFEWADGYHPRFGLLSVDRCSFERTLKPSAHWFGQVARTNRLPPHGPAAT